MTRQTSTAQHATQPRRARYEIRRATEDDVERLAEGIAQLVAELRGEEHASLPEGAHDVLRRLVGDPRTGRGLLAERIDEDPPVLAAALVGAYMPSVRLGGPYFFVQDMWVAPEARSSGVGIRVVNRLMTDLAADGIHRAEGVFPRDSFSGQGRTRQFYQRMGVKEIGMYGRLETEPDGST